MLATFLILMALQVNNDWLIHESGNKVNIDYYTTGYYWPLDCERGEYSTSCLDRWEIAYCADNRGDIDCIKNGKGINEF